MIRSRIGTARGPGRRDLVRPGCGECGCLDRCPTPDSGYPGRSAALLAHVTSDFTRAGQSHQQGPARQDEDLHSPQPTSLDDTPCAHYHYDDLQRTRATVSAAAQCGGQLCAHGSGLPLPRLRPPVTRSNLFCAVTPMDDRGRLADRSPIRAAGWQPGQAVTISASRDCGLVIVHADGQEAITRHGHLRLPARIRLACGLSAGDRLLVAVTARPPMLAVYPMATLEAITRQRRASASTAAETL